MNNAVKFFAFGIEDLPEKIMKIRITIKYLVAMFFLMLLLGELHEQVHINTGYLICGGYGERDFNVWKTTADCNLPNWSFLATAVGPIFSYLVMWTGVILLLKATSNNYKAIGMSLIFAPLPFARIFSAVQGGGDEKVFFLKLFEGYVTKPNGKILAAIFVTAICLPPLLIAWSKIKNRFAWLYVVGFSILPLFVLGFYVFGLLNGLLADGFLSFNLILGTPALIIIHTNFVSIILYFIYPWLLELGRNNFQKTRLDLINDPKKVVVDTGEQRSNTDIN